MKNLAEILGTKNRKEQVKRAQALQELAAAPVVDLVIRFDGRLGGVIAVQPIGGKLQIADALQLLEDARRYLLAHEKQLKEKESETPPEES